MGKDKDVLVVIGVGGMGEAIARRLGPGRTVLLADFKDDTLHAATERLAGEGHDVTPQHTDVSDRASVAGLAKAAEALGRVAQVAHTAGLSPSQAPIARIVGVDLLGVALVLEEFGRVVAPGGAGLVVSSMAGQMAPPLTAEQEQQLARTPVDELANLPFVSPESFKETGEAYGIAKRANQLRVQAASVTWGERGARVNSISPGVISTPMGRQELASESGAAIHSMIDTSPAGRIGTPDDIAAAAAFLLGPEATFITGVDLLVDGGVVASLAAHGLHG